MLEFNAVCAYTQVGLVYTSSRLSYCSVTHSFIQALFLLQSDEITLIFPAVNVELKQTMAFSGRIQKIASLTAGRAVTLMHAARRA